MDLVHGDVSLAALLTIESSSSAELGKSYRILHHFATIIFLKICLLSSPHPSLTSNPQRDTETLEARLMDHNDLFVLDFGKLLYERILRSKF